MDRQEIIILFILALIAAIGMFLVYSNLDVTGRIVGRYEQPYGSAVYPQVTTESGISCHYDSDCYWAYNSLNYECRVGFCKPKNAIGPPKYYTKFKAR